MRPDAQLELQAPRGGLGCNEAQHIEVLRTLGGIERLGSRQPGTVWGGKLHYTDLGIARHVDKVRVDEMEVVVCYPAWKVILQAKAQREPVEAAAHQTIQISAPEFLVVVPGLIFQLTAEIAAYTARFVRRSFFHCVRQLQRVERIAAVLYSLSQFEQSICKAPCVVCGNSRPRHSANSSRHHS